MAMAVALSSSTATPTTKLWPPSTSQPPRFLLPIIPSNPSSNTNLLTSSPSHKWRLRISFFPAFLNKGKGNNVTALKQELLQAIEPLDRGAEATPEDQEMVDQISRKLEAVNPTKEPLKSDLLNGKWELIYTTSRSILQTERPKFLRSKLNYQGINVDSLRAQNMESWPFFNQIPVKAPGRARGELEITYLDEELRISRGDKGNLFILKMIDPSYRVPV
ncbi:probable plastid-lipid-associated protein 4, chloroplastic isoform X2 [Cucumis sativus]|uniref:probable plastid-lipid-associated protein 4, chloroplastic isoform X2 n=1 Tax=Cucumis sativus TaxID=3659 RepID=UPI0012F503A9|nr:probable plastid-lipid-associated protein 4, chloroplastic isoform X2 [Cucumis sativus]